MAHQLTLGIVNARRLTITGHEVVGKGASTPGGKVGNHHARFLQVTDSCSRGERPVLNTIVLRAVARLAITVMSDPVVIPDSLDSSSHRDTTMR